jgi:hypothetical protein
VELAWKLIKMANAAALVAPFVPDPVEASPVARAIIARTRPRKERRDGVRGDTNSGTNAAWRLAARP